MRSVSPGDLVRTTPMHTRLNNANNSMIDLNAVTSQLEGRLGRRAHRPGTSPRTSPSPSLKGNLKLIRRSSAAPKTRSSSSNIITDRKIVIVGRFATPKTSPGLAQSIMDLPGGAAGQSPETDHEMDCFDADDEAEAEMDRRGRSQKQRALSYSSR